MIEAVHNKPREDIDSSENECKNESDDVVTEDHVIDNAGVDNEENSVDSRDGQTPKPGLHSSFIFL